MSIHGHEVMNLMLEADTGFSRDSLLAAMSERFGADARYHTCSASEMTADELIDFLAARGKFVDVADGFTTDPSKVCNHN
ncbi:MAG: YecH family metal-binding protein [Planctomycetota bacterium]|jgi:probable metal-binding protein